MSHRHHHHRDRARANMRRNLKIGTTLSVVAVMAVRLMTWINLEKIDRAWILGLRISLVMAILVGLVGGIILFTGIMQWLRIKSGL